tara:strand:- start:5031 stop:14690 length:9660 start_codon:yes stop_codon:yes gene_type:complete
MGLLGRINERERLGGETPGFDVLSLNKRIAEENAASAQRVEDIQNGVQAPDPEQQGSVDWLPLGDGAIEAGIMGGVSRVGDLLYAATAIPETIIEAIPGTPEGITDGIHNWREEKLRPDMDLMFGSREMIDERFPQTTWEGLKQRYKNSEGVLDNLALGKDALGYMAQTTLTSVPEMFAMVMAPYAYAATRTAEIAESRQENTGRDTNMKDLLIAGGTATVIQQLDKLGLGSAGMLPGDVEKRISKAVLETSRKAILLRIARRAGKGMAGEMSTEALQEYTEFVAERVEEFGDLRELVTDPAAFDQALAAAIGAAGMGAAGGTLSAVHEQGVATIERDRQAAINEAEDLGEDGDTPQEQLALPAPEQLALPPGQINLPPVVTPPGTGGIPEEGSAPAEDDPEVQGPPVGPDESSAVERPTTAMEFASDEDSVGDVVLVQDAGQPAEDLLPHELEAAEATERNLARLIERAEAAGAAIRDSAAGTFVQQAVRGKTATGVEDETGFSDTPAQQILKLFKSMAEVTAVESRKEGREKLQAKFEQASKEYQDAYDVTRRAISNESDAVSTNQTTGLLTGQGSIKTMEQLGLPGKALADAAKGDSTVAVRDAVDAINEAAKRQLQRANSAALNTSPIERGPDMTGRKTDPKEREASEKADEFRRDAQNRGTGAPRVDPMRAADLYAEPVVDPATGDVKMQPSVAKGTPEYAERSSAIQKEEQDKTRQTYGPLTDYNKKGNQYARQEFVTEEEAGGKENDALRAEESNTALPAAKVRQLTEYTKETMAEIRKDLKEARKKLRTKGTTDAERVEQRKVIKELTRSIKNEYQWKKAMADTSGPAFEVVDAASTTERTRAPSNSATLRGLNASKAMNDKIRKGTLAGELEVASERLEAATRKARGDDVLKDRRNVKSAKKRAKDAVTELGGKPEKDKAAKKVKQALRGTAKSPSGPINKPIYGVGGARLKHVKNVLEATAKAYKKDGKGVNPSDVKGMADIVSQQTIAKRGLGTIWVLNEEATDPKDMLTAIEGAFPKRDTPVRGADGRITKITRAKPQKPNKDTRFSSIKNRTYFKSDEVVVIRGRRVKSAMTSDRANTISFERDNIPLNDSTISPTEYDGFLEYLGRQDFAWDGKVDEFAMAQYLLGMRNSGPSGTRSSKKDPITPRTPQQIIETPAIPEEEDIEVIDDLVIDGGLVDGLIDMLNIDPNSDREYRNRRKELETEIAILEADLAAADLAWDELTTNIIPGTPEIEGAMDVKTHMQWPYNETYHAELHETGVISMGNPLFGSADVVDGDTLHTSLSKFVEYLAQSSIDVHKQRLQDRQEALEELNEANRERTPGPSPRPPGPNPPVGPPTDEDAVGPKAYDQTGTDRGNSRDYDPRVAGREPVNPDDRRAYDPYKDITQITDGITAAIERAGEYRFSGTGRLAPERGLNDIQVNGTAMMFTQWVDALKTGVGGFLNIDGTGLGKSRQLVAGADMIAKEEIKSGKMRPVMIITPGIEAAWARNADGEWGSKNTFRQNILKEFYSLGEKAFDPRATYENGTPMFEFRVHTGMQNEKGNTEYAAVLADEAHNAKGYGIQADGFHRIKAPFRAFYTATPTDMGGQEVYYLAYMFRAKGESFADARRRIAVVKLGLTETSEIVKGKMLVKYVRPANMTVSEYIQNLEKLTGLLARKGAMVARTYGRLAENFITPVHEANIRGSEATDFTDHDAVALYHELAAKDPNFETSAAAMQLMEHMKIPYMLARTLERVRPEHGYTQKIIAVFNHVGNKKGMLESKHLKGTIYEQAPIARFEELVRKEGIIPSVIAGDSKPQDKDAEEAFNGDYRADGSRKVLIGSATRISEGMNLNDKVGNSPRYMLISQTPRLGESFMQLLGRHDRMDNKSKPYTDFVKVDLPADRAYRQLINEKRIIQEKISGVALLQEDGAMGPQIYDYNEFIERRGEKAIVDGVDDHLLDYLDKHRDRERPIEARDVVGVIAKTAESSDLRELATAIAGIETGWDNLTVGIMSAAENAKHKRATTGNTADVLGTYTYNDQHISIGSYTGAAQTMLHEVAHHFSQFRLETDPLAKTQLTSIMKALLLGNPSLIDQFPNAFRNMHEFTAEFHSDLGLQAELKETYILKGRKVSAFTRLLRFFGNLIGVSNPTFNAYQRVMDLDLLNRRNGLDFDSMPLHRMQTPKFRRAPAVAMAAAETAASKTTKWASPRAREKWHKMRRAMHKTMTFNQMVEVYKRHTERDLGAGTGNILADVLTVQESISASSQKNNASYQKEVTDAISKFAQGVGRKKVTVRLRAGEPKVTITKLEYLTHLVNTSGYNQLHFGKAWSDKANAVARGQAHSREAWKLHSERFNHDAMAEAKELYNHLADYFAGERAKETHVVGGTYLDTLFPDAMTSWVDRSRAQVKKKLKELSIATEAELAEVGATREDMKALSDVMQPGVVPGAYFPLRRYGDYVILVEGRQDYGSDAERDALLAQHPAGKDDPDKGEVVYQSMARYDTLANAEIAHAEMKKEFPADSYAVVHPPMTRAKAMSNEAGGATITSLMTNFTRQLDKRELEPEQKKTMELVFANSLLDMLPDTSTMNTMRERKGTHGGSKDLQRVLIGHGAAQGWRMANLQHSKKRMKLMQELSYHVRDVENKRDSMGNLLDRNEDGIALRAAFEEISNRELKSVSQSQFAHKYAKTINDAGFAYYLVGASYNIVNMTQVPLVAYPQLAARHGHKAATKALANAYMTAGKAPMAKLFGSWGSLKELRGAFKKDMVEFDRKNYTVVDEMIANMPDKNHKNLIQHMVEMGDIEASLVMDMGRASERSHIDSKGHPVAPGRLNYLTDWMRMAPHLVEIQNRAVVAVAAFDLEYAKLKGLPEATRFEKAKDYARQSVKTTQFVYQTWNKPPIFQHPAGGVMLMFKQHVQHMYYLMIRNAAQSVSKNASPEEKSEARNAMAYFIGMHVLAAGAVGATPEPLKWLVGLAFMLFSDDDEPFEYDRMVRDAMYELAGDTGATIASQGLPGFVGLDLSSRIGIDSMLMYEGLDLSGGDEAITSIAKLAGGAALGMGANAIQGYNLAKDGNLNRGIEKAMPKVVRDAMRSKRYHEEGMKDLSGKTYYSSDQLEWHDYFYQALGFTPKKATDIAKSRGVGFTRQRIMDKRATLFTRYYNASTKGERADVIDRIKRWNKDNPSFGITRPNLIQSVKRRRKIEAETRKGVYTPKGQRSWAKERQRSY